MSTISPIQNRYRFVELYYRRSEQAKDKGATNGGTSKSARIETTVIFLPDTSSIMPNRLEWEDVQSRYKEALQNFLASKEKPAEAEDAGAKEIPIITISDDNDAVMETTPSAAAAENVDELNSVKKPVDETEVVLADAAEHEPTEPEAEAVVVNPDSSITDKALITEKQKFLSLIYPQITFSQLILLLITNFTAWIMICILFCALQSRFRVIQPLNVSFSNTSPAPPAQLELLHTICNSETRMKIAVH